MPWQESIFVCKVRATIGKGIHIDVMSDSYRICGGDEYSG